MSKKYLVLRGLDFMTAAGKPKRVEAGTLTTEIPRESVRWLIDQRCIEAVADAPEEARAVHAPPEDKMARLVADKGEDE